MKFPEFLTRKPEDDLPPVNKKGEGFRFGKLPRRDDIFRLVHSRRVRIAALVGASTVAIFVAATNINAENAFLLLAVLGLA